MQNQAPYMEDINNSVNSFDSWSEYKKYGLQNDTEFRLMKYVKDTWGTAQDFSEVLQEYRRKTMPSFTPPEPEEEKIGLAGVGEKIGTWISDVWEAIKFQSDKDDSFLESSAKFLWNLPWNTLQLWWDILKIVSDPVDTLKDLQQVSDAIVQTWLNKVFGTDSFTNEETRIVSDSIKTELDRIANEPWRLKELVVENPTDILLTVTGGFNVAKNTAKAKGLTSLSDKLQKVEDITNPIKLQADAVKWGSNIISKWKNKLFPEKSLDDIILETSQWDVKSIPAFKESLWKLDTKQIKTYNDLNNSIDNKIKALVNKQDELLPKENIYNIDDLNTTKWKRSTNFVKNALDDLEKVWNETNDLDLLNKVDELSWKDKLNVKDINDLARFYGKEFKSKSFDKQGNPKTSINATRFENNRKWLKDKSRELLPNDSVKLIDEELSNLFTTQELSQKMAKNVVNLQKKIAERWLLERGARWVWRAIDLLSLGTLRWFFTSFLPSNVWNKILNSLSIQENLSKNLKKIEKLTKDIDKKDKKDLENEISKVFNEIIWESAIPAVGVTESWN